MPRMLGDLRNDAEPHGKHGLDDEICPTTKYHPARCCHLGATQ